jgi:hypothetical protein
MADWSTVLGFEFAVRKFIVKSILHDSLDFAAAMAAAMKDGELKERFLTTPTAISNAMKRHTPSSHQPGQTPAAESWMSESKRRRLAKKASQAAAKARAGVPTTPQGKGKGKGKKGKPGRGKNSALTPDGRQICFAYNQAGGCTRQGCQYVHICNMCFIAHEFGAKCSVAAV